MPYLFRAAESRQPLGFDDRSNKASLQLRNQRLALLLADPVEIDLPPLDRRREGFAVPARLDKLVDLSIERGQLLVGLRKGRLNCVARTSPNEAS